MNLNNIFYLLPGIIIGLTVHEFCHALAAYKLGDHTAKDQGRLSFNPIKHIDIIGFLFIVIAGFGWAKPVQFNPENLKSPRRDKAIIAAAGPFSNLVLAFIFVALLRVWMNLPEYFSSFDRDSAERLFSIFYSDTFIKIIQAVYSAAMINLGLFIFNLLPLPPLDGSHIVFSGLNLKPETERNIMKIGMPLLFLIIVVQNRTEITIIPIGKIVTALLRFLMSVPG